MEFGSDKKEIFRALALSCQIQSNRSVYWKLFLSYLPWNQQIWPFLFTQERSVYSDLKSKFNTNPQDSDQDVQLNNPLSLDAQVKVLILI